MADDGVDTSKDPKSPETIDRDPKPDAEVSGKPPEAYDADFEYLLSSKDDKQGESEPPKEPEKPKPGEPPAAEKKEEPPKVDEPPTVTEPPVAEPSAKPAEDLQKQYTDLQEVHRNLQSTKDSEITLLKNQLTTKESELSVLNETKVALEEIKKEPLAFLHKYVPQLASQVSQQDYIHDTLTKQFGENFEYDSADAYRLGTPSYNYRVREQEIREAISKERMEAEFRTKQADSQREALLLDSKKRVMKEHSLTEEQFNTEIGEWSKTVKVDYDLMARIKFQDKTVKKAVDDAIELYKKQPAKPTIPPSPAAISGKEGEEVPADNRALQEEMGDLW